MKYLLFILLFFSCQKKGHEPTEPRIDSVAVLKDTDGWYIQITARYPASHSRAVHLAIFYPQEVRYLVKIPTGKIEVMQRLNPQYGEPVRWEVIGWGAWPLPD